MAAGWDRLLAGAAVLGLAVGGSAALAQGKRGWVDPPVAASANPSAPQWPDEAARRPTPQPAGRETIASEAKPPSTRPAAPVRDVVSAPVRDLASAPVEPERERRVESRRDRERERAARAREARAEARLAAREARAERQRAASAAERRRSAERALENRRVRVAEPYGATGDFEVMRLRTYELPNGRRVQVITRPAEQRFFDYPYR